MWECSRKSGTVPGFFNTGVLPESLYYYCGYDSCSQTLKYLNIETLIERREKVCLRFSTKSLNVENFKHLFPLYRNEHEMKTRHSPKYEQAKTTSKRNKISTIPHLQRILNKQAQMQNIQFKKLKISNKYLSPVTLASLRIFSCDD